MTPLTSCFCVGISHLSKSCMDKNHMQEKNQGSGREKNGNRADLCLRVILTIYAYCIFFQMWTPFIFQLSYQNGGKVLSDEKPLGG